MRFLADTNVVAQAAHALRTAGHDVTYAADRSTDPGDEIPLSEAEMEKRIYLLRKSTILAPWSIATRNRIAAFC